MLRPLSIFVLSLLFSTTTAAAAPPEASYTFDGDALAVTIVADAAPNTTWIVDATGRVHVPTATRVAPEPIALAILYCGWEMWIGNDAHVPADDPSSVPGALASLATAISQLPLDRIGPPGSRVTAIAYSDGAKVVVPPIELRALRGAMLGTQRDYANTTGVDLATGVELAVAKLRELPQRQKILLVIGDGQDTLGDQSAAAIERAIGTSGVELRAIVHKAPFSAPGDLISKHARRARTIGLASELPAALGAMLATDHRSVVTFRDVALPARVFVDGVDTLEVTAPRGWAPIDDELPAYPFVLVGAALLAILAVMLRDRASAA